jgi:hypothetical protein
MFFIHMFIQQIFRFTPSSTLRANKKLIIARRVAIAAYVRIVQDRPSYVRKGFYIGIKFKMTVQYTDHSCSSGKQLIIATVKLTGNRKLCFAAVTLGNRQSMWTSGWMIQ